MAKKPAASKAKAVPVQKKSKAPAKQKAKKGEVEARGAELPIRALRGEIDRLFETFEKSMREWPRGLRLFDTEPFFEPFRRLEPIWSRGQPRTDVVESDEDFRVTAELPGLEEKDIDVTLSDGVLTIKGEKEESKEEKKRDYHVSERRFGSFRRSFTLPPSVDADKVQATMQNGVLTVVLPKVTEAKKPAKKVRISKG